LRAGTNLAAAVGLGGAVAFAFACARPAPSDCGAPPARHVADTAASPGEIISLADRLAAGRLRTLNREVAAINSGTGVRVTTAPGVGLIWIEGTDFLDGAIEVDVCGRDVDSESFLGVAFHRRDDTTFEAVYLRPFNFRTRNAERRQHAVQYIAQPDYDYSVLRQKFPEEFEHAVDRSILPTAWIPLRLVVHDSRVRVFVGLGDTPALDVRELHAPVRGQVGLFVGNGSDGVFANMGISHVP
jgi:hypothetical protein